jgi:hypothetical protein
MTLFGVRLGAQSPLQFEGKIQAFLPHRRSGYPAKLRGGSWQ